MQSCLVSITFTSVRIPFPLVSLCTLFLITDSRKTVCWWAAASCGASSQHLCSRPLPDIGVRCVPGPLTPADNGVVNNLSLPGVMYSSLGFELVFSFFFLTVYDQPENLNHWYQSCASSHSYFRIGFISQFLCCSAVLIFAFCTDTSGYIPIWIYPYLWIHPKNITTISSSNQTFTEMNQNKNCT